MIESFTKAWFANIDQVREKFLSEHPYTYLDVVKPVIEMLYNSIDEYDKPDPSRIHVIDDGEYQGTLVYVIGASGYQPSRYWYVKVDYGSCSGCDTLESIRELNWETPTEEQVKQYMTLALHILQGLKEMGDNNEN